ncbi:hypothetical protein RGV33_10515 [Pseudomonas sp. Bout1]|uniref:hypothetical protein n=1 Tax=Pseudomonas sp. Bout1 TaxID=3048600 RepID=UPI002AB353B9|nr:hypothetical protein [Pseudomonas sp. Bout1]MDY7532115.1 hypothetical protein [Pseudomonas sp. Bout1]MEB0187827.1 hypothetical protein [Pseudomonas sp. Bout1]
MAPDVNRDQWRHHPAGHEHRSGFAQQVGNLGFKAFDQRTAVLGVTREHLCRRKYVEECAAW